MAGFLCFANRGLIFSLSMISTAGQNVPCLRLISAHMSNNFDDVSWLCDVTHGFVLVLKDAPARRTSATMSGLGLDKLGKILLSARSSSMANSDLNWLSIWHWMISGWHIKGGRSWEFLGGLPSERPAVSSKSLANSDEGRVVLLAQLSKLFTALFSFGLNGRGPASFGSRKSQCPMKPAANSRLSHICGISNASSCLLEETYFRVGRMILRVNILP